VPAPELAGDLALDADHREAVALVKGNAGFLRTDDAGEHRMEAVIGCDPQQLAENRTPHPEPVMIPVDIDRVLDRRSVPGPIAVEAQAAEPDDPRWRGGIGIREPAELGHHHDQSTRALGDVAPLLGDRPSNQVERDRRSLDLPVVDPTQRFGVGPCSLPELHRGGSIHRDLGTLPFGVVQNWPLPGKVLLASAIFVLGFIGFLAVSPAGDDSGELLTDAGASEDETDSEPAPTSTGSTLPAASVTPETGDGGDVGEQSASPVDAQTGSTDGRTGSGEVFEPLRNRDPKFSQYADVPSSELDLAALTEPAQRRDNGSVGDGQFRAACEYSHFSYDDPIVFPGESGRSHLHMFFGNTTTNAFTTTETLLDAGGGTCNGFELNRSAYWTPALLDGQGNVVVPDKIILYYKSKDTASVQPMPQGLKMVAGNTTGETFTASSVLAWSCGASGAGYNYTNRIPDCGGDVINASIVFPNCWDGVNLDSGDHLSHLTYVAEEQPCPNEYPVRLPQISILLYFPGTDSVDGWHLSSDRASGFNTGPGATLHADWWGGWNDEAMDLWTSGCMRAARNCSFGQTGTDRQLAALNALQTYEGPNFLRLPEGSYPGPS